MKISKKTILIIISMIANIALTIGILSIHSENKADSHPLEKENVYEEKFMQIAMANEHLFAHNYEEALEWYNKIGPETRDWERMANQYITEKEYMSFVQDSLITKVRYLYHKKAIISDQLDSLTSELQNKNIANDSLGGKMDKQILAMNKMVLKNHELEEALELVKNSYGQLVFEKEGGNTVKYFGEIKNGKATGYGIGFFESKGVYEGYWEENKRHGKGKYTWANGDIYEGEFVNGKKEGYGTYLFVSHEKYVGNWKGGLRDGKGVVYSKEGKVLLDGNWKEDKYERKHRGGGR